MHRWAKVSTAVVAACVVAVSKANAQSANIDVTANVFQAITVVGTRALDFGSVFPGIDKTIAVAAATSGLFSATGQAGANVSATFSLPTDLTDGTNDLPIDSWTGCFDANNDPAGCTAFVPSAGASNATFVGGALYIFIGATVHPDAAQAAGTYTGTVQVTLSYF